MKKILMNIVSPVIVYALVMFLGIFVSQIFLIEFGSEVNGLISSVNQIFSYVALMEAGIGTATVTALHGPLSKNDNEGVGEIVSVARTYYRRMTIWYLAAVCVISVVWPLTLNTTIPFAEIFWLVFIQGISNVLTFYFTAALTNYLIASGRNYINNNIHLFFNAMTYTLKLVICCLHLNIIYLSISLLLVNVLKCLLYGFCGKKYCGHIRIVKNSNKTLLKEKNSCLVHEISAVIFYSTDTIIISIFCGLKEASIYATYSLVLTALNTIISQLFNGTNYVLGNSFAKNRNEYHRVHDMYNTVYICGTFALFTVAYILLPAFIQLYTKNVIDISYIDPYLPLLFVVVQLLSLCRNVANKLIQISLNSKATINRSLLESILNISLSLILVNFIGMYGVLIGTIVALLYRSNDMIIYANKKILKRCPLREYKLYFINFLTFFIFVIFAKKINVCVETYGMLVLEAVKIATIVVVVYALVNVITNVKLFKESIWIKRKNCQ